MTKKIKSYLFVFACLCLFSAWFNNASSTENVPPPKNDPASNVNTKSEEGWYKTKWGMTIEEIRAALKEEIKEHKPAKREEHQTDFSYTIPDFKIGNFMYDVYLGFNNKKLSEVLVRLKDGQNKYGCFLDLDDSLKKKYGSPTSSKDEEDKKFTDVWSESKSREWILKTTIIRLNYLYLWCYKETNATTNIQYQYRKDTSTDKL